MLIATGAAGNETALCGSSNCTFPQGQCINGTCQCEVLFEGETCESFSVSYLTAFAILSYLVFFIASIQLILCMVMDSNSTTRTQKLKKAFSITIQKCLLGTVILATSTRAIYFTVQIYHFPEKWADLLHNLYYPAVISGFSVLICFWAEVFCNSELSHTHRFLRKHYFMSCVIFNILLYLLLLSDVIATPLIDDAGLAKKSIIIGFIFAALLFMILAGFLHYSIRLFFRPDWRPLYDVFSLKINLNIQISSIIGVLSSAVMQCIVISLLILNLIGQYLPVDSHSLYTSNMVIHIIELGLPTWFCCCLWNFKRPASLWVLNPSVLLQRSQGVEEGGAREDDPLMTSSDDVKLHHGYGTITDDREDSINVSRSEEAPPPDCWICLDVGKVTDLFRPCSCPPVHRECLDKWIKEKTTSSDSQRNALQCGVCKRKYAYVKSGRKCLTKDLKRRHWLVVMSLLLLFIVISSLISCVTFISSTPGRVAIILAVVAADAVILKIFGFCMLWAYRRSHVMEITILGESYTTTTTSGETKLTPPSINTSTHNS